MEEAKSKKKRESGDGNEILKAAEKGFFNGERIFLFKDRDFNILKWD